MGHYLLRYDVVADYAARRAALRDAHLTWARAAVARGELLLGGAVEAAQEKDGASTGSARTESGASPDRKPVRAEPVEALPSSSPFSGALLLFAADTPDVAAAFARGDPYVTGGLVTGWRIERWRTVVGAAAAEAA